mmetsp:Transcript_18536/g.55873  ORF Transcript_18536/g.55873 Transcript_18536/m.55873 type:complete len:268 (-) Transcript_18536:3014-3817(-)
MGYSVCEVPSFTSLMKLASSTNMGARLPSSSCSLVTYLSPLTTLLRCPPSAPSSGQSSLKPPSGPGEALLLSCTARELVVLMSLAGVLPPDRPSTPAAARVSWTPSIWRCKASFSCVSACTRCSSLQLYSSHSAICSRADSGTTMPAPSSPSSPSLPSSPFASPSTSPPTAATWLFCAAGSATVAGWSVERSLTLCAARAPAVALAPAAAATAAATRPFPGDLSAGSASGCSGCSGCTGCTGGGIGSGCGGGGGGGGLSFHSMKASP